MPTGRTSMGPRLCDLVIMLCIQNMIKLPTRLCRNLLIAYKAIILPMVQARTIFCCIPMLCGPSRINVGGLRIFNG